MNDQLLSRVARQVDDSYYGKYRGLVTDNADPDARGRLRVLVPSVLGEDETDWAEPVVPFGGVKDAGLFVIPPEQAIVWVEFEEGDIDRPLWTGTRWIPGTTSGEDAIGASTRLVLQTPGGHRLELDDTDNDDVKPRMLIRHHSGGTVTFDADGGVELHDAEGTTVTLDAKEKRLLLEDANGNSIEFTDAGLRIADANGNSIELVEAGLKIADANGNSVDLVKAGVAITDANGHSVELASAGVTISGKVNVE